MTSGIGIIAFIVTMFVMIMVHEFGHFIVAKRVGMKVEEFSIGFGPRLALRRKGETEYSFRGIPLGGYVKIAGMNPFRTVPESDMPRTYGAKPAWQRAAVLVAGSTTHLILAFIALFAVLAVIGEPVITMRLDAVNESVGRVPGPAMQAGMRPGDEIIEIEGQRVSEWEQFRRIVRKRAGVPTRIIVERDGRPQSFIVTPAEVEVEEVPGKEKVGLIGVLPKPINDRLPLHVAAWTSARYTALLTAGSVLAIGRVFSPSGIGSIFDSLDGRGEREPEDPAGLVGGARIAGQAAASGEVQSLVWILVGFIVFVGVINLVPLPPFDGGHLLVLVVEKVSRRRVDMRKVVPVAVAVFGFLMVLQLTLLYLDIVRPIANPFQ